MQGGKNGMETVNNRIPQKHNKKLENNAGNLQNPIGNETPTRV